MALRRNRLARTAPVDSAGPALHSHPQRQVLLTISPLSNYGHESSVVEVRAIMLVDTYFKVSYEIDVIVRDTTLTFGVRSLSRCYGCEVCVSEIPDNDVKVLKSRLISQLLQLQTYSLYTK